MLLLPNEHLHAPLLDHPVPAARQGAPAQQALRQRRADLPRQRPHRGRRGPHDDSTPDGARPREAPVARTRPHGVGRAAPARGVQRRGAAESTGRSVHEDAVGHHTAARRPAHGRQVAVRWRDGGPLALEEPPGPSSRTTGGGPQPRPSRSSTSATRHCASAWSSRVSGWHTGDDRESKDEARFGWLRDDADWSHRARTGPRTGRDAPLEDIIRQGVRRRRGDAVGQRSSAPTRRCARRSTPHPGTCADSTPHPAHAPTRRRARAAPTRRAARRAHAPGRQKMISPALRRLRSRATASSRMSAASVSLRRSFT